MISMIIIIKIISIAVLLTACNILSLWVFNILVLSSGLNDNSNESYNIEPSTLCIFNISFYIAFIVNLFPSL